MRTQVFSQNLAKLLGTTLNVVEKKSTIPVLSNILIQPNGANSIRITGTDLDVTAICNVTVEEIGEGSEAICIPGKKLLEILRTFPTNTLLDIEKTENNWVKLKAGKANFKLAGTSHEQFPETPRMPQGTASKAIFLSPGNLSNLIELTQFAITMENSRFTLSGAKLMVENGVARMVATDGHRLALAEIKLENAGTEKFDELVPKKALGELLKICREMQGSESQVKIDTDANHIFFEIGGWQLITRKLSGTFPNYEMVIPKQNDLNFVISAETLRDTLSRVRLLADERTNAVKIDVKKGELHLDAVSAEEGEAHEQVEIAYTGDDITFGINSNYGQDYLAQILNFLSGRENKNLVVHLKDGNTQIKITLEDEANVSSTYILMPLRI